MIRSSNSRVETAAILQYPRNSARSSSGNSILSLGLENLCPGRSLVTCTLLIYWPHHLAMECPRLSRLLLVFFVFFFKFRLALDRINL